MNQRCGAATAFVALMMCATVAFAQADQAAGVRHFEVISTDGNHLVVRDESGIQEYTVPPDFRFTVDGKSVGAADLKSGMRGTATLTEATSTRPVHVTFVKMGTVVAQTGRSVTVKEDNGQVHRFTQAEADARDLQIYMDGKPVRVFNLNPGDRIDATIVTAGTPEILTAQALDESLAAAGDAAAGGAVAAPAPAPAAAAPEPARDTAAATPGDAATTPNRMWLWIGLLLVVAVLVFFALRGTRPRPLPKPETRR
jgi:hypothetical protein